jgi:hypothetical protein
MVLKKICYEFFYSKGSINATMLLNISTNSNSSSAQLTDYVINALLTDAATPNGLLFTAVGGSVTLSGVSCVSGCSPVVNASMLANFCINDLIAVRLLMI